MAVPYDIKFGRAYSTNSSQNIEFNKGGSQEVTLTLKGTIGLAPSFLIEGVIAPFPRVSLSLQGDVKVSTSLSVLGVLKPYPDLVLGGQLTFGGLRVSGQLVYREPLTLRGQVQFPSFSVQGEISTSEAFNLGGIIPISTKVRVSAKLVYDEDVFRGSKSEVSVPYRNASTLKNNKGFTSVFSSSARMGRGLEEVFRGGTKLERGVTSFYEAMQQVRMSCAVLSGAAIKLHADWATFYQYMIFHRLTVSSPSSLALGLEGVYFTSYYTDLQRERKSVKVKYGDATRQVYTSTDYYRWGTPLRAYTSSYWREAVKLVTVFSRRPVTPPKYEQPRAEDFNLRFSCPYRAAFKRGDYNLYFGMTRCKRPYVIPPNGTYIMENTFVAKRVADNQPFEVFGCSVDTDDNSWCWSGSFTIPAEHLQYVKAITGQLPLIELVINGDSYVILVESFNRSRSFNQDTYTVKGRSISALLDDPHSAPISYTNDKAISAVQLIQQMVADTVGDTLTVVWEDLVSDIGWVLAPESVSVSNQSVIKAIASIIEPVGGMVFTHPSQPVLVIKKVYPYAHWENPTVINHTLAEDIVTDEGTSWERTQSKNGVYVTDPATGNTVKVLRRGTAGERLAEEINSPIVSSHQARVSAGKHALIKANTAENKSLSFPFLPQMNHLYPADTLCITTDSGQDWGIINSVSVGVSVSNEGFIDVGYSVGVTKFMETGLYG